MLVTVYLQRRRQFDSMSQAAIDHYMADYARVHTVSDWLDGQRQSALDSFRKNGFPSLKHEHWKYTDIRSITRQAFVTASSNGTSVDKEYINSISFTGKDELELIFVNGQYSTEHSRLPDLPKGVIIQSLSSALTEHRALVETHLNQTIDISKNGFIALNTAFISNGVFIYIPDNCLLEQVVNLLFISTTQSEAFVSHLRNLIVLGNNAQATVIESYIGNDDAKYFNNSCTEIITQNGANLQHYKLQQEGLQGFHIWQQYPQRCSLGGAWSCRDGSGLCQPRAGIAIPQDAMAPGMLPRAGYIAAPVVSQFEILPNLCPECPLSS